MLHQFDNKDALAEALADAVASALATDIETSGAASLAVSGGSTPRRFFQRLSQKKLDWQSVTITLVDERWVPADNERSNAKLVAENLLQNEAADAQFVGLYHNADTPDNAMGALDTQIAPIKRPFSAVVLGMGADAHTASFFPGGNNLETALDVAQSAPLISMQAEGAGEPRITWTLSALLQTNLLTLHIEGGEKKNVLEQAEAGTDQFSMPIRSVLHQRETTLNIYWCP